RFRYASAREAHPSVCQDQSAFTDERLHPRGGHGVTPVAVHLGFKVSADSDDEIADATPVSGDPAIPRYRTIEIYGNNFPGQRRFIGTDWELNEFCYDRADIEAVEASPGVPAVVARVRPDYTGKPIYTLPISIWRNSRTRPRIIEDGLGILYAIVTGDANVEHEDASGNKWGWDEKNQFQEGYSEAKTLFIMDGLEDQTKNVFFFPPPGTVPAVTRIRGGGGEYCLHADQGSVMVQLHANSTPGGAQAINMATNSTDKLCGLQVTSPVSLQNVRACLGKEFNADESVSFDLSLI
ncbi:MAG: hypothetical protein ACJAVK_001843, partial [Akkermansiaceae bacterium]